MDSGREDAERRETAPAEEEAGSSVLDEDVEAILLVGVCRQATRRGVDVCCWEVLYPCFGMLYLWYFRPTFTIIRNEAKREAGITERRWYISAGLAEANKNGASTRSMSSS
jgi:hypothetical protein